MLCVTHRAEDINETRFGLQLTVVQHVNEDLNYLQTFFISEEVAISNTPITGPSYYWPLSLCFPPVFLSKHKLLFSHPPLWPVICLFEVSATQSPALQWRTELGMFHTGHSMYQATRWTDEMPWSRHWTWFLLSRQAAKPKISLFGHSVMTHGGFSLPSKVLVCHNKGSNSNEMIHRQGHLFGWLLWSLYVVKY